MTMRPLSLDVALVPAVLAGLKDTTRRPLVLQPPAPEAVYELAGDTFDLFRCNRTPAVWRPTVMTLWCRLYGPGAWKANAWVWVVRWKEMPL